MERLVSLDQRLSLWVNQSGPSFLDPFWSFFSETVVWFPLYVLVVAFIFWRLGWKKGLVVLLTLILTVVVTDQLSVLVKNTAMRLRPCHDPWMTAQGVRCPDGNGMGLYGFFSSHASNVFGFAAGSWAALRLNVRPKGRYNLYGCLIMLWAALASLSRVMLAAHYLGDILTGTVFGLLVGLALAYAARFLIVKAKL